MNFNIAIDGPAGAGKSTIAKSLSERLGFLYVDTGALYRAMAYGFIRRGIRADEHVKISQEAGTMKICLSHTEQGQQVYLDEENITAHIRAEEVGRMASIISGIPQVREALFSLQKKIASEHDVVMDGRDIGTHILPKADLKIFLTASVDTRADRRYKELIEKGQLCDREQIKSDIRERDERDMNRDIAPLRQAEDAHMIDSSDMTVDDVVEAIYALVQEKRARV